MHRALADWFCALYSRADGRFDKRDFVYDEQRDEYRCPAGQTAIYRFTAIEGGKTLHKYWSSACGDCKLKPQCTPAPNRRISRWEHEEILEIVQSRLDGAPEGIQAAPANRGTCVRHAEGLDGFNTLPDQNAAPCKN